MSDILGRARHLPMFSRAAEKIAAGLIERAGKHTAEGVPFRLTIGYIASLIDPVVDEVLKEVIEITKKEEVA